MFSSVIGSAYVKFRNKRSLIRWIGLPGNCIVSCLYKSNQPLSDFIPRPKITLRSYKTYSYINHTCIQFIQSLFRLQLIYIIQSHYTILFTLVGALLEFTFILQQKLLITIITKATELSFSKMLTYIYIDIYTYRNIISNK